MNISKFCLRISSASLNCRIRKRTSWCRRCLFMNRVKLTSICSECRAFCRDSFRNDCCQKIMSCALPGLIPESVGQRRMSNRCLIFSPTILWCAYKLAFELSKNTRPWEIRFGKKPTKEWRNILGFLKMASTSMVSGWWYILKNKKLESEYNSDRLIEVTRQFKERFKWLHKN